MRHQQAIATVSCVLYGNFPLEGLYATSNIVEALWQPFIKNNSGSNTSLTSNTT
jgi:hypothetical protein